MKSKVKQFWKFQLFKNVLLRDSNFFLNKGQSKKGRERDKERKILSKSTLHKATGPHGLKEFYKAFKCHATHSSTYFYKMKKLRKPP